MFRNRRISFYAIFVAAALAPVCRSAEIPSAIEDLKNWRRLGLPMAAEWNVAGYRFFYHVRQIREGRRFLPSIQFPSIDEGANDKQILSNLLQGTKEDFAFLDKNGLPLCLRTNNIANMLVGKRYRVPKSPDNIGRSPLVWSETDAGVDDERVVDLFGSTSFWEQEGGQWAKSQLSQFLQERLPNPAYVIFLENNEGAEEKLGRYVEFDEKNRQPDGRATMTWKAPAALSKLSIRLRDRVEQLKKEDPQATPHDFLPEFWRRRRDQRQAFYTSFSKSLTAAWSDRLYTAGYRGMDEAGFAFQPKLFDEFGYAPQLTWLDAGSPNLYVHGKILVDFTSVDHAEVLNNIPTWEVASARNPKAYRELSLHISDGGIMAGAKAGRHEVITPERYEGWVQWVLWSVHDRGTPVLLRRWCPAKENPQTPIFRKDQHADLEKLGASELKNAVSELYLKPIISAVDRVCTNAVLREFWLEGEPVVVSGPGFPEPHLSDRFPEMNRYPRPGDPDRRWRVLECSTNPPRNSWQRTDGHFLEPIKVWAVATRLKNRVLLFAWTPCRLADRIKVTVPEIGEVEIDAPRPWGYWVVDSNGQAKSLDAP